MKRMKSGAAKEAKEVSYFQKRDDKASGKDGEKGGHWEVNPGKDREQDKTFLGKG